MLYANDNSNDTNKELHVMNGPVTCGDEMYKDIEEFKNIDPNFRLCIISQLS